MTDYYGIHVTYCYSRGVIDPPRDGFLRDHEGLIIVYASRAEAQHMADANNRGAHYLNNGEHSRPIYRPRRTTPQMRTALYSNLAYKAEVAAKKVKDWDRKDIHLLRALLEELKEANELLSREAKFRYPSLMGVDFCDLPSERFPDGFDTYHVWALDKQGMVLWGDCMAEICSLKELLAIRGR